MSKNLTRKGIALGALVALGSSLIAGTPALANTTINLEAKTGTTYSVPVTDSFTLKSSFADAAKTAGTDALKFEVTGSVASLGAITVPGPLTIADSRGVVTATGTGALSGTAYDLTLVPSGSATFSVTVKAWLDRAATGTVGTIDTGEFVSAPQVVTFVKASDITWTTTLDTPKIGDTTLTSYVSAAPSINMDQIKAKVTSVITGPTATSAVQTFDSATNRLKFVNTITNPASGKVQPATLYKAQAQYSAANAGSAVSNLTPAAKLEGLGSATITVGTNVKLNGQAYAVRSGTKSLDVSIQAYSDLGADNAIGETVAADADTKAAAGSVVSVTVAGTPDATTTITAGGKTLVSTTSGNKIEFDLTTDATGLVKFTLTSSTGKALDSLTVSAKSELQTTEKDRTIAWADATFAANGLTSTTLLGTSAALKAAKGSNYTLTYAVNDSFGLPTPESNLRVKVVQSVATNNAQTRYGDVVNGLASVTLPVAADSTDGQSITNTATVEKFSNGAWAAITAPTPTVAAPSTVIGTSTAASTVTVTNNTSVDASNVAVAEGGRFALNNKAFAAADTRVGQSSPAGTVGVILGGQVNDSLGQGTYSTVTLAGANLMFEASGKFSLGSITVQTDASGTYAGVSVYSNKTGKQVVTVTAGGATKTADLYFKKAAKTVGATLTISAPTVIASGRTLLVTTTLVDAYGNPVEIASTDAASQDLTITYDGPGFTTSTIAQELDATGKKVFRVILGSGENGLATIKATYSKDGVDTNIVTVTKNVLVGASATVAAGSKRANVTVKNALGLTVKVVSGSTTVTRVATSDSQRVAITKLRAGKRTVKVYVNDILVRSQVVTVRR
jgi:adhesin/invasin